MMLNWDPKDPNDVDSFHLDWSMRLVSETIAASTWAITPAGELTEDSNSFTTTATTIWLSAGNDGTTYELTNHITTTAGRQLDQTVKLRVKSQ